MVRYGKERKETPQRKVAGLEWYTRGTCRERSECNSDCYTQWQSRQQKVQVRMREAKTPQHKVAGVRVVRNVKPQLNTRFFRGLIYFIY